MKKALLAFLLSVIAVPALAQTGNLSGASVCDGPVCRTLAQRFGDVVNLKDKGAKLDGTTDDTTAINAARTAAGDNGIVVVPKGGWVNFANPTGGSTSPILWQMTGNAYGLTTTPVTGVANDVVETTLAGTKFFSRLGTPADAPAVVRIDSASANTGGTPQVVPTLQVNTTTANVSSNNHYWGINSNLHSNSTGSSQNVGIASYTYKESNGSILWAWAGAAVDTTGNNSITSGPIVGMELDMGANGTDTGGAGEGLIPVSTGIRVGIDMPFVKNNPDGSDVVFGWGIRIGQPLSGGTSIDYPFSVTNGVVNKAAFTTEFTTFASGADAIRIGPDQTIGLDGTAGAIKLYYTNIAGANALVETAPVFILNNGTSNRIVYAAAGLGAPTITTRTLGTKIVLWPNVGGATVDYAMGMEGGAMWSSVADVSSSFAWYAGTTRVGELAGSGILNVTGSYQVAGTKVVGARDTGWTAMTGSPDKATSYATGSVTLAQLAGRVAQLQASLTTHGLIGP